MSDPTVPSPESLPAAGWYHDPAGGTGTRWWDGKGWSNHVRPAPPTTPAATPLGETDAT